MSGGCGGRVKMKSRFISLLLALVFVAATAIGFVVVNEKVLNDKVRIAVLSDLHIVADSYYTDKETFYEYADTEKTIHLSEATAKTMVDEIIAQRNIKYVFVTGDITEDGYEKSHKAAANIFKRLRDKNIKVFIINGNHDTPKTQSEIPVVPDAAQFRKIYWECGYKDAVAIDDKSLSYAADIDKQFRLIAIDNDNYYQTDMRQYKEEISHDLIGWVIEQLEQCKKDGKTPIAIAHKPFVNHFGPIGNIVSKTKIAPSFETLARALADNGCHYIFTGHLHNQDTACITSDQGNKLYDIETASAVYLPSAYRFVTITQKEVIIKSKFLDHLNMDYASEYLTDSDYNKIKADYPQYCLEHFKKSIQKAVTATLNPQELEELFGSFSLDNETFNLINENVINPLLNLPIYGESNSLEKLVIDNGGQPLPPTKYKDIYDLASYFVFEVVRGDENVSSSSPEVTLLKNYLYALFHYFESIENEIAAAYPDQNLDIDSQKLFKEGKLEMIESGVYSFIFNLIKDSLPSPIRNLDLSTP